MCYRKIEFGVWGKCSVCGADVKSLPIPSSKSSRTTFYYSERFAWHIVTAHKMTLTEYVEASGIQRPLCACGCGNRLEPRVAGKDIVFRERVFGHSNPNNPAVAAAVARSKITRLGSGNPMYGVPAWNKGLTAETNAVVAEVARKRLGRIASLSTRAKQSLARRLNPSARHTTPHSEETKAVLRAKTLAMIARGGFPQTRSKPHVAMQLILEECGIRYDEEKRVGYFSFDFYLPDQDLYLEVDGDYFHSNPQFYPNGPKTATQKRNYYRDSIKHQFVANSNMVVLRFWENQILKNRQAVKEQIIEAVSKR